MNFWETRKKQKKLNWKILAIIFFGACLLCATKLRTTFVASSIGKARANDKANGWSKYFPSDGFNIEFKLEDKHLLNRLKQLLTASLLGSWSPKSCERFGKQ